MTKQEMIQQNEETAIQKIRIAYINEGLVAAMALCIEFMGVNAKESFTKTKEICADLEGKNG